MTPRERARAIRKIEIAIDRLIDAQAMGDSSDAIKRALELLNGRLHELWAVSE